MPDKLMIVAHPDDESLFGGAQLILESNWKVVCVTNGNNPVRRAEFISVMSATNCDYEIWNYPDIYRNPFDEDLLAKDFSRLIQENDWSKIVTHNSAGEYGHPHHIQIHHLLKHIESVCVFGFGGPPLSDEIWQRKVELVSLYKSQKHICDGHLPNTRNEKVVSLVKIL